MATLLVLAHYDPSVIGEFWGLFAIPLGVPWSIVPLLLDDFADLPAGLLTGMIALGVPLNALLLYWVARRLGRARQARAA